MSKSLKTAEISLFEVMFRNVVGVYIFTSYEKTPKKLPKHFAAKYKLRTFKRTASQVPHRLESFYGSVSSTNRDLEMKKGIFVF